MTKQKQCIDFYGERLKIGDEVIPMLEEALIIGISGTISDIEYSERYNNFYITITDKEGKVLLKNVDARCYTTEDRFNERENQEYVYSLAFINKDLNPKTVIPLTNKTDPNYEFPDETCLVILRSFHRKKDYYISSDIFSFFVDKDLKFYCDKNDKYLVNPKNNNWYLIGSKYRIFSTEEKLKAYIKKLIEYFNTADLTYVNNKEDFCKNQKGNEFEKKLIRKLHE